MTHNEYTVAINVVEEHHQLGTIEKYSTVVLVEADGIGQAEQLVFDHFEHMDNENIITHTVEIIKTIPKIHFHK
jgi:hypothetical protein